MLGQYGVIVGFDHGYGCLILKVQLLFQSLTGSELCCGEVVIHERLHSHGPLGGTKALDVGRVVGLRDHIAKRAGNLVWNGHVVLGLLC